MLAQRADEVSRFTRGDLTRFAAAALALIAVLTAILSSDILRPALRLEAGDLATVDVRAPRALTYISTIQTEAAREEARRSVPNVYTYSTERGLTVATEQLAAFSRRVASIDAAFEDALLPEDRLAILETAVDDLSEAGRTTLLELTPDRWSAVRGEAARVLDLTERVELRDSDVAIVRQEIEGRMAGDLSEAERSLAAELIRPLIVPNSTLSEEQTAIAREAAAAAVEPVERSWAANQIIVREGAIVDELAFEAIEQFGLNEGRVDLATVAGWALLAVLVVGALLTWVRRFRPEYWHRSNVLLLVALLLVVATFALKLTADRAFLPYILPTAAISMLIAILLDAGAAVLLTALLALVAGAVNGSVELAAYTFTGGLAGIVAVRKGDRLGMFVQAAAAVFLANVLVVTTFTLLGTQDRDLLGIGQLWGASFVAAGGAGVAAVGSFAVLGSVFGILTVFQMLELASSSQPVLRRLLVEAPGTYHHSVMVASLAERAAEAIGADTLLTRVAAFYHDLGKLANPGAFIENQAGGDNPHDQLDPETSAQILKAHVADGIDLAYRAGLPKAVIAFIPQHHGTAVMSYFYARAREQAAEPYGGLATPEGRKAADAVDIRKFRHAGPKPQTREAALIMLADGVEASVRSLSARDEPAIRAMVSRIMDERLSDGQFDECDLTFRDLDRIREAFVGQLLGMYHQRVAYPQSKVVELESRRAASGGGEGA
ncbi:MAG TPA: HDIG domain-containing protein [Candidatus Limnocylindrales bacterium]|nr:HDIG domain-containing protein [Candidatus Limnocylindrales bacterium]